MTVAIIDYGSGNLRSVAKAFERVAEGNISIEVIRSADALEHASHIVLPGVGAFADCMAGLKALPGMIAAMEEQVLKKKKPFLGICVGMQMLFERGHEHGVHSGLGWLKGEVVPLASAPGIKIPHMGWNELAVTRDSALLRGIQPGDHAYFVHSYHAKADPADVLATTEYGQNIIAIVGREHILGTQFHPEKSQQTGLKLIQNFLSMKAE